MPQSIRRRHALGALAALTSGWREAQSAQVGGAAIRIGQVLPMTGPVAAAIPPLLEAQEACLQDINGRGGIHGNRVELITLDDGYDAQKTVAQTHRLIREKQVHALFGYGTGAGVAGIFSMLMQRQVPLIGLYSGADQLRRQQHPYFFTTMASFSDEMRQMVRNLATVHSTRLAVAIQANDFGRANLAVVEDLAREYGATIVATEELELSGGNARQVAQGLAVGNPQAILLLAGGASVLAFMQAANSSARVPIYTLTMAGSSGFLKALGPSAAGLAITQIVPFPWRPTNAIARSFKASMERHKLEMSYDRMVGYLNVLILAEVLQRAGKEPSSASITAAIENMGEVDLGGYRVHYSKTRHHGSNFVELSMVGARGEYLR